jgi:hypothetical protein
MFGKWTVSLVLLGAFGMTAAAAADKQYGPGVSDTEIKIGNIMPYSTSVSLRCYRQSGGGLLRDDQ